MKHVALIDDDQTINLLNEQIITSGQFADKISSFTSGESFLEYLEANENTDKIPEVIFLDIDLLSMTSWDVIAEMRKLNVKCKIVILTGSLNPKDHQKALEYEEVHRFLTKPLKPEFLKEISEHGL